MNTVLRPPALNSAVRNAPNNHLEGKGTRHENQMSDIPQRMVRDHG
jgi:hypothetical protein